MSIDRTTPVPLTREFPLQPNVHDLIALNDAGLPGPGRMMRAVEHTPVIVTWRDAHFEFEHTLDGGWEHMVYLTETYGVLLPDAPPGHIALASEVLPDGGYKAVTILPECMVESVVPVGQI